MLTIWDKLKSPGTVIDWCTGREWPVNYTTVISARWQSNMPFQGQQKWHVPMTSYGEILSGRLNYYITQWRIPLFTKACSVIAPCALSRLSSTYIEESKPHRRTILISLLIAPTSRKSPSRKWIYSVIYIYLYIYIYIEREREILRVVVCLARAERNNVLFHENECNIDPNL